MSSLEYYENLPYKLEIIPDIEDGVFVARYPELPGCITVGKTEEEALKNALDAKKSWIQAALEDGIKVAEPSSTYGYSGQFKLRIPKSLHRALAERSRAEGISMNQYCLYLLSKYDAEERVKE